MLNYYFQSPANRLKALQFIHEDIDRAHYICHSLTGFIRLNKISCTHEPIGEYTNHAPNKYIQLHKLIPELIHPYDLNPSFKDIHIYDNGYTWGEMLNEYYYGKLPASEHADHFGYSNYRKDLNKARQTHISRAIELIRRNEGILLFKDPQLRLDIYNKVLNVLVSGSRHDTTYFICHIISSLKDEFPEVQRFVDNNFLLSGGHHAFGFRYICITDCFPEIIKPDDIETNHAWYHPGEITARIAIIEKAIELVKTKINGSNN